MPLLHRVHITGAIFLLLAATPGDVSAQQTADTAGVLLQTARRAEVEGRRELAAQLLRFIIRRYPDTPAARDAETQLAMLHQWDESESGRVALTVWGATYGSWLGIAVPAALGASDTEPFGAGLLIGAPLGFFGTRAFAEIHRPSAGQAAAIILGSQWGTWQGMGWAEALDIGVRTETVCNEFGCFQFDDDSDHVPFGSAVLGGLAGIGAGLALASTRDIAAGDATLANHASLWGGLFGLGAGVLASDDNDAVLAWSLVGGNVGLLGGILATRAWRGSSGRVRIISAAGLAGAAVGFGVDLLFDINTNETVIAPMLGSAVGLIAGASLTREHDRVDLSSGRADRGQMALVALGDHGGIGFPTPQPAALPTLGRGGRLRVTPAVSLRLLELRF